MAKKRVPSNSAPINIPPAIQKKLDDRITDRLHQKAEELGIDPFEILLLVAGGRHLELGYENPNSIRPSLRVEAAAECCKYLYPALKSVEIKGNSDAPIEAKVKEAEEIVRLLRKAVG